MTAPALPGILWVLLAGLALVLVVLLAWLVRRDRGARPEIGGLRDALELLARYAERLGAVERTLGTVQEHLGTLVTVLLGRGAGRAGERWAEHLLSQFPDGCLRRRVRMGQGEVEFAVVLPGELLVPVDSKFVASELLVGWEHADGEARRTYERRIAQAVRERAQEVATRYLTDPQSAGFGIAAVPDSVYGFCQGVVRDLAGRHRILLVPHSLLVPYVLSLYFLGQRLGLGRVDETQRVMAVARDALWAAISELEKMGQEITTVANQRSRALEHLRRVAVALEDPARSEEAGR